MGARIEDWVRRDGAVEQLASIDVADDETVTVTYELAARVLEWLGFTKAEQPKEPRRWTPEQVAELNRMRKDAQGMMEVLPDGL